MTSNDTASTPTTKKRATPTPSHVLAATIVDALLDKKGRDITVIDVRGATGGVTDFFVLCTGDVDLQIKGLTDGVRRQVSENHHEKPWHVEGYEHLQWVLMDYVDVVVHIFTEEKRAFYDLERLWGDAPTETVPTDAKQAEVQLLQNPAPAPPPDRAPKDQPLA